MPAGIEEMLVRLITAIDRAHSLPKVCASLQA
jgi:hypothetical protein